MSIGDTIGQIIFGIVAACFGIFALHVFLEWSNGELEKAVDGKTIHKVDLGQSCILFVVPPLLLWTILLGLIFLPINLFKYAQWKSQEPRRVQEQLEAERQRREATRQKEEALRKQEERDRYLRSPEYLQAQEEKRRMEEKAKREKAIKYLSLRHPTTDPSQFTEAAIETAMEIIEREDAEARSIAAQQKMLQIQLQWQAYDEKLRTLWQTFQSRVGQSVIIRTKTHTINARVVSVSDQAVTVDVYDDVIGDYSKHRRGSVMFEDIINVA